VIDPVSSLARPRLAASFGSVLARATPALRVAAVLAVALWAGAATAQVDKAVKFVLPNATGSGVDTITRSAQPALSKALGMPIVVENQPGAGGIVGVQTITRAAPDGSTLGIVSNNVVIFPSVYKSLPFTLPDDITPIAIVGFTPIVLVVNPKVPATNAKELVALLKSKPGEINYASSGSGTILHLACEMFLDEAGVRATHVPYKGVGPMVTDLIGGQVQFGTAALPSVQGHLKSGQLRAIGMATKQRVAAAPDIPTFVEQGMPNYVVEAWFAVIGPKGMNAAEVKRVHDAVVAAFADPAVKDAMAKQGNEINVSTPEYARDFFRSEMQRYAALVKKAGVEVQ
jgi:tripartite-type tricarboxylate transporter receptor subunit TctC